MLKSRLLLVLNYLASYFGLVRRAYVRCCAPLRRRYFDERKDVQASKRRGKLHNKPTRVV